MRVIPVLDILRGQVVRGIAGRREDYRPIQSRIVDSSDPLDVARAFRTHWGLSELYIADLDAIAGSAPKYELYEQLSSDGFRLWVDFGIRAWPAAVPSESCERLLVGTETLERLDDLESMLDSLCRDRVVVSIDLKNGRLLSPCSELRDLPPLEAVRQLHESGATSFLFLDLARVGMSEGVGTLSLVDECRAIGVQGEVYVGGGVRDGRDLALLHARGVDGVLVASALHDGRLSADDIHAVS